MRFRPDDRLIELMVGQLLYKSPEVAMRELLQNAEDACSLQRVVDNSFTPSIKVRYSVTQNWVEVIDNGLGMNAETIEQSFAAVGAPKERVGHIRDLLGRAEEHARQIAVFGVGILSCFGVAESIVVRTKMDGHQGLAFRVVDYHDEFKEEQDVPTMRSTSIRLDLKPGGLMRADQVPQAVLRYARHTSHVELENTDTGECSPVPEQWNGNGLPGALRVEGPAIRDGYLALDLAWNQAGATLHSGVVVCNGGFLVRDHETDLLPQQAIGYTGELDVLPQGLTIQLDREGFVRDEKWTEMGSLLTATYNNLIRAKVTEWEQLVEQDRATTVEKGVEQGVLLLTRGPTSAILGQDILDRLNALVTKALHVQIRGENRTVPIQTVLERAEGRGVIYYTREGERPQQFQQALSDGAATVNVTEVAQTEDLRAAHLKLKGAVVLSCRQRSYNYVTTAGSQHLKLHDVDLVTQQCQKANIRFVQCSRLP